MKETFPQAQAKGATGDNDRAFQESESEKTTDKGYTGTDGSSSKNGVHGEAKPAEDGELNDPEAGQLPPLPGGDDASAPKKRATKKRTTKKRATKKAKPLKADDVTSLGDVARRVIEAHGNGLRYVPGFGWYAFNGKHWRSGADDEVHRLTIAELRALRERACQTGSRDLFGVSVKFDTDRGVENVASYAAKLDRVRITPAELDPSPHLLAVENGTLDLRTGKLRKGHDPADMITAYVPTPYDPEAASKAFDSVLGRLAPDPSAQAYLQRGTGYGLCGKPREDVFFLVIGPTRSCKSTFLGAMAAAFGERLVARVRTESFCEQGRSNAGQARSDLHRLRGARFAVASEAEPGQRFATGLLKSLSGGEPLISRTLQGVEGEAPVTFTLWIFANPEDLPHIRSEDEAVWERARKIPVGSTIPEAERDPKFRELMKSEAVRKAVLAWAVRGAVDYHKHGLGTLPDVVRRAGVNLRADMDDTGGFIESCLVFDPEAVTTKTAIRKALREALGKGRPMPTDRRLVQVLRAHAKRAGVNFGRTSKDGEPAWRGVRFA